MSAAELAKQATVGVRTGEVSGQLLAISSKIDGSTGTGKIGTSISIGTVLIGKVSDGLGETRLATAERILLSLKQEVV